MIWEIHIDTIKTYTPQKRGQMSPLAGSIIDIFSGSNPYIMASRVSKQLIIKSSISFTNLNQNRAVEDLTNKTNQQDKCDQTTFIFKDQNLSGSLWRHILYCYSNITTFVQWPIWSPEHKNIKNIYFERESRQIVYSGEIPSFLHFIKRFLSMLEGLVVCHRVQQSHASTPLLETLVLANLKWYWKIS